MQRKGAPSPSEVGGPARKAAVNVSQFLVQAPASFQERRPRTLKHGDTFGVFDHYGDALASPGGFEGLYHRDTRHLSQIVLAINGVRPLLLSSTLADDNAMLTCDLTNPDLYDAAGQLFFSHDLIHIRRSRFLWNATCHERIALRNFDVVPREVRIDVVLDADFVDLFEVRGTRRAKRGTVHAPELLPAGLILSYTGLDKVRRTTTVRFTPQPHQLTEQGASFEFSFEPFASAVLLIEIACDSDGAKGQQPQVFLSAFRSARRAMGASSLRSASMTTSNETFNEAIRRSLSDLAMLSTETRHGPFPYAGIPWFSTVFGRDALITALQTLWIDPDIARGVLGYLAEHQATQTDPRADAQPGKILHEMRHGEMAQLGEVPFRHYYGSVDATPLFVMLAGAYLDRTGDLETIRRLWPNIEAALGWISEHGDSDGDGFVEYGPLASSGLVNQGWKDSFDSVFHADGRLAHGPIAIVEVQGYVYGAWSAGVKIANALGHARQVATWLSSAEDLRRRFDQFFFDEELGTYILALDRDKKPCRVLASNAGQVLFTGIAYPERAKAVVAKLGERTFFSGWGIRTLASTEVRYNPMSYHNGSVWPHDNALIAAGFGRYGFRREAARIFEGLYAASTHIDHRRLPELFCGFSRQRSQGPTLYPVACIPQAWAASAPLFLIQTCLGLDFDLKAKKITLEDPVLPDFVNEIIVRRLRVGTGHISVAFRRSGSEVVVNVLSREGDVRAVATT